MNWSHAGLRPNDPTHLESHRRTQMHTDSDPVCLVPSDRMCKADSPEATCGRAEPGLWMRGMRQVARESARCVRLPWLRASVLILSRDLRTLRAPL